MAQPVPGGKPAQRGGQEPGGEGVPGADGRDDVDPEGGNAGDGVRAGPAVADTAGLGTADTAGLGTADTAGLGTAVAAALAAAAATATAALEQRRAPRALLHHQCPGFGQGGADRVGAAGDAPGLLRLVPAHEDEVAAAGQFQQDGPARLRVGPEVGPVVDVERDEGAGGTGGGQFAEQGQAVGGERGGDAGEVQDVSGVQFRAGRVVRGHRRGGGTGPVVEDFVVVRGPVARGAEVDSGGAVRVAAHGGGVDAVPGDRLDEMVAEPVVPDPADPLHAVPRGREDARHVGLGAADPPVEGGHVGEPPRPGGQERDHGLAERDHVDGAGAADGTGHGSCGSGGGHDDGGSLLVRLSRSTAPGGTVDPALAGMLDSSERHTQ